jgi:hypothetical protein
MDLQDVGWVGMDWIELAQDRDRLLWMRYWTSGFHKMQGISWLAEKLLAFQEDLCSMELVVS